MEDLEVLMSRLVSNGTDRIIANPEIIKKLIEKGIPFKKPPKKTLREGLDF